jgi:hypothetical protein
MVGEIERESVPVRGKGMYDRGERFGGATGEHLQGKTQHGEGAKQGGERGREGGSEGEREPREEKRDGESR